MDEQKKKKEPKVYVGTEEYPEQPSMFDYLKESFEPTEKRAELQVLRDRRRKLAGG